MAMVAQDKEKEAKDQKPVKIKLAEKQILRKGNDLYKEKRFVDAEVKYKKALKENPHYQTAGYRQTTPGRYGHADWLLAGF